MIPKSVAQAVTLGFATAKLVTQIFEDPYRLTFMGGDVVIPKSVAQAVTLGFATAKLVTQIFEDPYR
ncbi:hypothetical protein M2R47_09450, partial [Moraxella sp. Tifton1]|nr:hypothetical protein [Moraxella sp. Tifton1]